MFGNGAAAAWQWRLGFFAVFSNDSMVPDNKALEQGSALVLWGAMDANKSFRNDAMGVGMQFSNGAMDADAALWQWWHAFCRQVQQRRQDADSRFGIRAMVAGFSATAYRKTL